MSDKRLTLFPADPFVPMPDIETFTRKLTEIGFLEANAYSPTQFILGRIFRELLDTSEEMEHYHIPAWIEMFEEPTIQVGSDIQYMQSLKTPHGKEIGDADTANQLIAALREDAHATWQEPRFRQHYLIYGLDFDHYLAFGNHFLQLGIYLQPSDSFLQLLSERTGIEYQYANYQA